MKKLFMSVAFIALVGSVPADAGSTLAIGGGFNLGHVQTTTGAMTHGTAAAGSRSPTGPTPTSVLVSRRLPRPVASRPGSGRLRVRATPQAARFRSATVRR